MEKIGVEGGIVKVREEEEEEEEEKRKTYSGRPANFLATVSKSLSTPSPVLALTSKKGS